jgi:hypothetical protein
MKSGFIIIPPDYYEEDKFFLVSNYEPDNTIHIFGFKRRQTAVAAIDQYDIGIWQPKGTKKHNSL